MGHFENYFKAGNYLVSKEAGAFAKVKYFDLEVPIKFLLLKE